MNAQAGRLSTNSENIANADTVGYKAASAQFRTMLIDHGSGDYTSGGVDFVVRYGIDRQGVLNGTQSSTDLAISGQGFFVVADGNGTPHLTRAGSFIPDAEGHLVNAAGYKLMGMAAGGSSSSTTSLDGLTEIAIDTTSMAAIPSRTGVFAANLPASAAAVAAGATPAANSATSVWTEKSSLIVYDSLGDQKTLDIYFTKIGDNQWEATLFDQSASTGGGFPYSSGPISVMILEFDPANGKLTVPSPATISVGVPGGETMSLSIAGTTQLGAPYSVSQAFADGAAPSRVVKIQIDDDGTVSAVYANGAKSAQYEIRLATVPSIDNLQPLSGNIYDPTRSSGPATVGTAGLGSFGSIKSSALESSTVDIATELTEMIETQRAYTANSKAFQVATDMADVLVNLKV